SLKADRRLGPCPRSDHELIVRRSGDGSYFVGCEGYPDCRYTLPLPSTGEPLVLDEACEEHGLGHVKMLAGRDTFVHGCPQCAADEADESEDRVIGACPECGGEHDGNLAIKHLRSGSRLVGCTRYPDCDYSLPLPRRGEITVTDEYCDEHGLPALVVDADSDDPWELGCPICNYREYRARNAVSRASAPRRSVTGRSNCPTPSPGRTTTLTAGTRPPTRPTTPRSTTRAPAALRPAATTDRPPPSHFSSAAQNPTWEVELGPSSASIPPPCSNSYSSSTR
ncbi:hypothetical protein BRC74_04680, partial [Halobacteriales archaeon QH_7_68_42]